MSFQSLLQRNYFCNLAFIGVLDMYPNPYFISFFPILLFLMVFKVMLLPLFSGKKSHPQNPCWDHFSFNKAQIVLNLRRF